MKISNSKKQLGKIISENGGWRELAEWSIQDSDKNIEFMTRRPEYMKSVGAWYAYASRIGSFKIDNLLPNWHQTILSRDEYFHLYPAPDADGWIEWNGGECPVDGDSVIDVKLSDGDEFFGVDTDWDWHQGSGCDIIAYRLRKPEQAKPRFCESVMRSIPEYEIHSKNIDITQVDDISVVESRPTIEQLAADYRNAKDCAERKQQEADDAKADAEAKLAELVAAGGALGLVLSVASPEPELVITDWRDLQVGDEIATNSGSKLLIVTSLRCHDDSWPIDAIDGDGITWSVSLHDWRFIRRP